MGFLNIKNSLLATVAVISFGSSNLFAGPQDMGGGITPKTKLMIEISTLNDLLGKGFDEESQRAILTQMFQKKKELRVITLNENIERCDYMLKTHADLRNWRDLDSGKDGITMITEERARYVAELEMLK